MLLYINLLILHMKATCIVYGRFDKKFDMRKSWSLNMWVHVFIISKLITKRVSIYPNNIRK